jgi:two-component system phosphate regulon sensor histidine kinase PhoR
MLAAVDVALALLLALALVALVRVAAVERARREELDAIRRRLGASDARGAVELAVDRLDRRAARDAAERDELRADAQFLQRILEVGLIRLDADNRVKVANPAAHDLLGVSRDSLVGRTVIEAFIDQGAEAVVTAAIAGEHADGELAIEGPDGRRVVIRARRSPGGVTWIVLGDVTQLRRLQQIRAQFIDNVSHELRTPLSTVSLLTETLASEAEAADIPPRMRDRIAKIEIETGHLVQMVNELLDLATIEGGGALALRDGIDLGALAESAAERLSLFAERQRVGLRVDIAPGLPTVVGDGQRLGQVLVNLVHNAVKFSPDGGDVAIRARQSSEGVIVSVEDHGIGIPKADRDRVFERFYKVDRARTRSGGGTGLGLAISRHVVEQHGGRIWVESKEGDGSTFSFLVPTGADDSARRATRRQVGTSRP